MSKIDEAKEILSALGLPNAQQNEVAALTLLALCGIHEKNKWSEAKRQSLGLSRGIMAFITQKHNKTYAPNTRETIRKEVLHQFVQGSIADKNPDKPNLPVNSPLTHYAINEVALEAIKKYGSKFSLS